MPLTHGVMLDGDSLGNDLNLKDLRATVPHWDWHPNTQPAQTAERIRQADIIITNKVVLDRALLAQAPTLKLICVAATGTNNVDLAAAAERGICVSNVVNYGPASVAQHTLMLMLNLATRAFDYQRAATDGRWSRSPFFCLLDYPIVELAGKTLGIVGYGTLGKKVGALAQALGMQVLVSARPGQPPTDGRVAFDELLAQADVLSLHCPLTPDTQHLINRDTLAKMKPGALLINCARGPLLDETAVADALRSGQLGGAGLDVLSQEPPSPDHPLLQPGIPNLIVTPHTAWASREARQNLVNILTGNILAFSRGQPRNRVTPT
ncbi:2-hydroxyacid dehydrogenase [Simiduia agarivorans]|uniref:Lactate dehydrogenase-like oxidoreductase n=1 Tax=Simiduia agarivorans (strain DSM 21679 / JCM 13881 / BCRC 17597 / SA1) TaxID=1117647 RepID=K4KHM9_SIMAS|nr:2-hydroxyacid dehydrogenase [Simiduia agarivorans]AFU98624.1 lactate dehydrogenase-like oxidoreductase [Simiduia agarivorans SA1 = DSM 21679]